MRRLLPFLLLFAAVPLLAKEAPLTLYRDARFEIVPNGDPWAPAPDSLCAELRTVNPELGRPRCAVAGSLERNDAFRKYAAWLTANLRGNAASEDLEARHPEVRKILEDRRDDYLLLFKRSGNESWVVVFHDGKRGPSRLVRSNDKGSLDRIADLFSGPAVPIPTEKEREEAMKEPIAFYRDQTPVDFALTVGAGGIWGVGGHRGARIDHYTHNTDSASAWDWLHHASPALYVEYGVTYARFVGIGAFLEWSRFGMKYDEATNPGIEEWTVDRFEFGVRTHLGYTWLLTEKLEINPYLLLGFHFTAYNDHVEWESGAKRPMDGVFELVAVKGGSVGAGCALMHGGKWALRVETGLSNRSRKSRDNPVDGGALQDRPAESTFELFLRGGLSWNMRKWR